LMYYDCVTDTGLNLPKTVPCEALGAL
jgi:hypothetical protein